MVGWGFVYTLPGDALARLSFVAFQRYSLTESFSAWALQRHRSCSANCPLRQRVLAHDAVQPHIRLTLRRGVRAQVA
jgi:hypothetical protein